MSQCRIAIISLFIFTFFTSSTVVAGIKLAILPIHDITHGDDGISWPITEQLHQNLSEMGFEVLSRQAVVSFLSLHRIRALGQIETYHIELAQKELGVKLILLGTVCQSQDAPKPALALALYLIRTDDGRTIWSNVESICCADTRRLLGINEPNTIDEIAPLVTHNILSTWPAEFNNNINKKKPIEIETVWLRPTYVHSGQVIHCSVHLRNLWVPTTRPKIYLKVGEKIINTEEITTEGFFETSWHADGPEGRYPVSLVIDWPDGSKDINLLNSYYIDNTPPEFDLDIKGYEIDGKTIFRKKIAVKPRMRFREQLIRWKLNFENEKGVNMLSIDKEGFPPEQFIWHGTDISGKRFPNGDYRLTMQVWDRAENMAESSHMITIYRERPELQVNAKIVGHEIIIELQHEVRIPVAYWNFKLQSANGVIKKTADGNDFPAQIIVPFTSDQDIATQISAEIIVQDVIGNETTIDIENVLELTRPKMGDQNNSGATWVEEF